MNGIQSQNMMIVSVLFKQDAQGLLSVIVNDQNKFMILKALTWSPTLQTCTAMLFSIQLDFFMTAIKSKQYNSLPTQAGQW